ncbi:hypothetical protein EW146_g8910 [Bondarzewia mesenterica]|uniref:Uncharacterized protein n=1 Tax=Bondarzewia mesenterica TaxID=1095465 RepID=A0A4S4LAX4_9AGAM|nr:hypothetical protein EW146_g8910 [Bondarzewia mesenterica]
MSRQSSYHNHPPEDAKASYDDLIDQYAAPYALTSKHKSYTIDPASKQSFSTFESGRKEVDDDFDVRRSSYPPPPLQPQQESSTNSHYLPMSPQIIPDSLACRLYVVIVLLETAVDLGIEGDLLVRFNEADALDNVVSRKMPVYLSVFVFAHVFQLAMAIDAVYARNTLQFVSLTIFNALLLVYAIIQTSEIRNSLSTIIDQRGISHIPVDVLTTILPIVISVSELAYIALGWKIYTEFGWKVYKFLGADRRIKQMYAHYQIFQCLVKFDVFFWVGFSIQFIWLVLNNQDWEYYVTCAALPLSVVLLVEGHLAARYENKWMMLTFMSGCIGAMVYFFYKLVKVLIRKNTPDFTSIWQSLTTFSIIAIILLLTTFVYACIIMRNFGRGLKEQLSKKQEAANDSSKHGAYPSLSIRPNRMSID